MRSIISIWIRDLSRQVHKNVRCQKVSWLIGSAWRQDSEAEKKKKRWYFVLHEYGVTCIWKMSLCTPQSIYWSCPILAANGRLSSKTLSQQTRGQLLRSINFTARCASSCHIIARWLSSITHPAAACCLPPPAAAPPLNWDSNHQFTLTLSNT